jgi:hypothetical protein
MRPVASPLQNGAVKRGCADAEFFSVLREVGLALIATGAGFLAVQYIGGKLTGSGPVRRVPITDPGFTDWMYRWISLGSIVFGVAFTIASFICAPHGRWLAVPLQEAVTE